MHELAHRLVPVVTGGIVLTLAPHADIQATRPSLTSLGCGVAAGAMLFALLARRLRPPPLASARAIRLLTLATPLVVLGATAEELIWRYGLLGSLLPVAGVGAAAAVSTAMFAVAHAHQGPRAIASHLVTGSVFAGLYLSLGSLTAAVGAHIAYNLLVVAACLPEPSGVDFQESAM